MVTYRQRYWRTVTRTYTKKHRQRYWHTRSDGVRQRYWHTVSKTYKKKHRQRYWKKVTRKPRKKVPPPPKKYRRVSYGWSAGPDYGDYRVTKYVEEDQDPTLSRGEAERLLREGYDSPYNEWPYWSRGVKDYKSAVWATEDELVDESELPVGYRLGEWYYELYRGKGEKSSW